MRADEVFGAYSHMQLNISKGHLGKDLLVNTAPPEKEQ